MRPRRRRRRPTGCLLLKLSRHEVARRSPLAARRRDTTTGSKTSEHRKWKRKRVDEAWTGPLLLARPEFRVELSLQCKECEQLQRASCSWRRRRRRRVISEIRRRDNLSDRRRPRVARCKGAALAKRPAAKINRVDSSMATSRPRVGVPNCTSRLDRDHVHRLAMLLCVVVGPRKQKKTSL